MKTKPITLSDFKGHPHPASKLFRFIELQTVYERTKGKSFKGPSMDLGGGDGYLSSILFDKPFDYNVDNGEANDLHIAIEKKRYKKVLVESAEHMSLKDDSLNFVFSNSVVEHIPDIEAVLSEVSRTLKKDGVFVFTSPSDKFKKYLYVSHLLSSVGLTKLAQKYEDKRNKMLNHYHTYSHTKWTKLLKKHGLIIKEYAYYIDHETALLWDKIAIETRIRSLWDKDAEKHMYKKYRKQILERCKYDHAEDDRGASLYIYAVKK